ncbi:MAG: SurA N-terminal domain-containing protein [Bacteroidetes bacterium]|nr:SurA N-terminal domain-containing protein [Bacteroidota bacterium]
MSILARIRSRVGLLVGIIFLALLAFVLTDLFNSQRGIFGGAGSNDVGEIGGHTVSLGEFRTRMDEISNGKSLSESEQAQLSDGIWQELVNKYVYGPQYDKLGISVTIDELSEQLYGPHPTPYLNRYFSDQSGKIFQQYQGPDGQLSGAAVSGYVKQLPAEQESGWAMEEQEISKYLLLEKYNTLLRKGFYVTTSEANHEYADENTKYNFKFIVKKYADVPDSLIKPSDAELKDYYNSHQYKFKQHDDTRDMEFLPFDVFASADDIATERKNMETVASDFKEKTGVADSEFVEAHDDNGVYEKKFLHPGQFPAGSDSAFLKAASGDVLGPFQDGGNIEVFKKFRDSTGIDSIRVRHILVAYKGAAKAAPTIIRTKEKAKMRADSILKVVKAGKKKMEDIVEQLSDDPGAKQGNKGDYGWLNKSSPFIPQFISAGYDNNVGDVVIVESDYGYHVIQVVDKKSSSKVEVVTISKKIVPSDNTIRDVYNKALEFAGRNNTGDLFTQTIQKDNKVVSKATDVKLNDKTIANTTLDNPKEIIRWMFDEKTEVGSVSSPFQSGDRYVVCHLTKIINKGVKPFEDVRDICEPEVIKDKKAKMFTDQLNKVKANSLDQWATNAKLTPMNGTGLTLAQPYIQGAGFEPPVLGTIAGMKPGELSMTIKGTIGVYVVLLESVTKPEPMKDLAAEKTKLIQTYSQRADASSSDILNEAAEIIDNRAKHF